MGLSAIPYYHFLLILNCGSLGFIGIQLVHQREIQQQLSELSASLRCPCEGSGVTPGGSWPEPHPSMGGNPIDSPRQPEVEQWNPKRGEGCGAELKLALFVD